MRNSISRQITFAMILLIATVMLFCILINTFFLESYYTSHKQSRLENAYRIVSMAVDEDRLYSEDFTLEFEKLCADDGLSISVLNSDGSFELTSEANDISVRRQIMDMLFASDSDYHNIVLENENYSIYRSKDARVQTDYLLLWGTLNNGDLIAVRTAVENIRDAAGLSTRFLLIVGVIAVAVAIVFAAITGRRIAKPITGLDDISRRMSELDFEARYEEGGHDPLEIEELGAHMNKLSSSLETTISKLKTANNELMLDNERKTKVDEMRREFLSNVSHELKTPLALISGYAEGLKDGIDSDRESREYYIDVILDETDKMTKMVGKLLTLNRIEFGSEPVELTRFDMTGTVNSVLDQIRLLADEKGIRLEFEENNPLFVWSDEFQVEEVVTNYLSNALNHCYPKGVIRVTFERKESDNTPALLEKKKLRVNVYNTGDPIPEESLDKVWIKFYKVDKARTREYGGSGIGLSIVKAIMESLNETYGVYNVDGGVCFYFEVDLGGG